MLALCPDGVFELSMYQSGCLLKASLFMNLVSIELSSELLQQSGVSDTLGRRLWGLIPKMNWRKVRPRSDMVFHITVGPNKAGLEVQYINALKGEQLRYINLV